MWNIGIFMYVYLHEVIGICRDLKTLFFDQPLRTVFLCLLCCLFLGEDNLRNTSSPSLENKQIPC